MVYTRIHVLLNARALVWQSHTQNSVLYIDTRQRTSKLEARALLDQANTAQAVGAISCVWVWFGSGWVRCIGGDVSPDVSVAMFHLAMLTGQPTNQPLTGGRGCTHECHHRELLLGPAVSGARRGRPPSTPERRHCRHAHDQAGPAPVQLQSAAAVDPEVGACGVMFCK